ncbi:unnamed protein product [Caretta caretta]
METPVAMLFLPSEQRASINLIPLTSIKFTLTTNYVIGVQFSKEYLNSSLFSKTESTIKPSILESRFSSRSRH